MRRKPQPWRATAIVPRRAVLRAMAGIGGCAAIVLTAARATASAKLPQDQVSYQVSPKVDKTCSACVNYEGNRTCKVVEGDISPDGWCRLWNAR